VSRDDLRYAAGLIGFCATLVFCGATQAAEPAIVVVFGDSISKAWAGRVEQLSAGRLRLVDESRPGRPTDALEEFDQMLARQERMDLVVLALGTNDSGDISAASVPRAAGNLRKMVHAARKAAGADQRILIVGPPNMSKTALLKSRPIADQRVVKLEELNRAFADLATQLGCRFVSLYGVVPESSLAEDGMHPDPAGNVVIARLLLRELLSAARR
jgi:acyl-CoA thioesterase-1